MKLGDYKVEISTLVSIGTIVVILLSYYSMVIMYALFSVNITPFLEPSEIIFSATPFFVGSLILGTEFWLLIWLFKRIKGSRVEEGTKYPKLVWLKKNAGLILGGIAIFFVTSAVLYMTGTHLGGLAVFLAIAAVLKADWKKFSIAQKLAFGLVFILGIITVRNVLYAASISRHHVAQYFVEIKTDRYHIKSDSTFLYIGSTKNFVFFWDCLNNRAKSYATSDLQWITTTRNPEFRGGP